MSSSQVASCLTRRTPYNRYSPLVPAVGVAWPEAVGGCPSPSGLGLPLGGTRSSRGCSGGRSPKRQPGAGLRPEPPDPATKTRQVPQDLCVAVMG